MSTLQSPPPVFAFSADVRLVLSIGNHELELADAGPTEVILRHARQLPTGVARIITTIDGQTQIRDVIITGQGKDQRTAAIAD